MNRKLLILAVAGALVASGVAGYWLAMQRTQGAHPAATAAKATERTPLYWHDPMHPQQKFDKPGRSPFMDMDLVPVYAGEAGDASAVTVSPRVMQNLGVRIAEVTEGSLQSSFEAVGAVAFDERSVAVVQARVNGFIEKLFARAPLDAVVRGQPLAEILAPEWVAAQEEYLALRRSPAANPELRAAARKRLLLVGMNEETVAQVEAEGRTRASITLTAPITGVIAELGAREGMAVMAGAMLFRINGLATVWVNAEVPESRAGALRPGAEVHATVPAYPGERFPGRITAILPEVNAATRTLKARVEVPNPHGKLKPGMYATLDFAPQKSRNVLLVPSEAVIRTGTRDVVMVAEAGSGGQQRFRAVDVEVGAESGGNTEIRKGLERGMRVVASGQFLIDSESSLKATTARMEAPAAEPKPAVQAEPIHRGEARVERIGQDGVTLSHGPIASLEMPAMTMVYKAPPGGMPAGVKEGARVDFAFKVDGQGQFALTEVTPRAGGKP
jgi:Cu(I)/Ag(I) efflux system membrane fusion protein